MPAAERSAVDVNITATVLLQHYCKHYYCTNYYKHCYCTGIVAKPRTFAPAGFGVLVIQNRAVKFLKD